MINQSGFLTPTPVVRVEVAVAVCTAGGKER